jgi:hypothetical protein
VTDCVRLDFRFGSTDSEPFNRQRTKKCRSSEANRELEPRESNQLRVPLIVGKSGAIAKLQVNPVLGHENSQRRYLNRKPRYAAFLDCADSSLSSGFSDNMIRLVLEPHSGAAD